MNKYNKQSISLNNELEMKKYLSINDDRIQRMLDIKLKVFNKELSPEEARKLVNKSFESVSAEEFAYGEQHLFNAGITDEIMAEGMDDILDVFRDVLVKESLNLPKGHPIQTYANEAEALERVLREIESQLGKKFIKNEWLDIYSRLSQINTHFSRKQHQLFPALERKGFDRPSKIMWTFDDKVRDAIKDAFILLEKNHDDEFIAAQTNVLYLVRDILQKERDVLYPTSLKLLDESEFAKMRISDDEIGYCLINNPPEFILSKNKANSGAISEINSNSDELIKDLQSVLEKHGLAHSLKDEILNVSNGKLTLEQINLIYKHMKVDLSYVDENDVVKFYTDTKHRVFPRSAGVIGRLVQNCHPRDSVASVEAIIDAFRKGEQDEAEFWIDNGKRFIYIVYNAVRDDEGNFKGVLEMMQDVTHIRNLTGNQRLLSWSNPKEIKKDNDLDNVNNKASLQIDKKTLIGHLINEYPFIKEFLSSLSPQYNTLSNPVVFKTMKNIATLDMISKVGGFEVSELIKLINKEIVDRQQVQ